MYTKKLMTMADSREKEVAQERIGQFRAHFLLYALVIRQRDGRLHHCIFGAAPQNDFVATLCERTRSVSPMVRG